MDDASTEFLAASRALRHCVLNGLAGLINKVARARRIRCHDAGCGNSDRDVLPLLPPGFCAAELRVFALARRVLLFVMTSLPWKGKRHRREHSNKISVI